MKNKSRIKFWTDDLNCIFKDVHQLFPKRNKSLEKNMNCLTRLILILFIIFIILDFDFKNNLLFLFISLFIIIILYNKQKRPYMIENFEEEKKLKWEDDFPPKVEDNYFCESKRFKPRINYTCGQPDDRDINKVFLIDNRNNTRLNPNTSIFNKNFEKKTNNKRLNGEVNPKTLIPPIIPNPLADIEYWRKNSDITQSIVNKKKPRYDPISGYNVLSEEYLQTDYINKPKLSCYKKVKKINQNQLELTPSGSGMQLLSEISQQQSLPQKQQAQFEIKETFTFPYETNNNIDKNYLNDSNTFYNKSIKKNPYFKNKYATNIVTSNINDDLYLENDTNEPINSLIGISEPIYQEKKENENEIIEPFEEVNMTNVYDPRFYGYGTSYREYFDENIGQPRYYYDDIDAIKMPNYLSRNNLDVTPFGDSFGPMNNEGNIYTSDIHGLADQHYMESMNTFRDELQERLMRKKNKENWQRKLYPIHKNFRR
jgi:hypothetical protein